MSTYNVSIDLHAMQATAKADLISARLLWNIGLMAQSIWLLQQSAEKYLKCLWANNRNFSDENDLKRQLKCLGHDIKGIFDSLDSIVKKKIKSPMWLVRLDNLRYSATFGYSYGRFRLGEKFINEIRILLKEKVEKSQFDTWNKTTMRIPKNHLENIKTANVIKSILALSNPRTKKERNADKRRWAQIISGLNK